jgi:hypothetical protein
MKSLFFGRPAHLAFKWRFDHLRGCGSDCSRALGDVAMAAFPEHDLLELNERLRDADAMTAELMAEVIDQACQRFPLMGESEKTARLQRLIATGAWTDAALALIDLELPLWQVRRLAYDEGEWYCALSRQRELPDWLDQSIEAHHADLALAILTALVDTKASAAPSRRTSVPAVPREASPIYDPLCCDNFV